MLDKVDPATTTFVGWMERFGLADNAAAELLSLSRETVRGYRTGEKIAPASVLMACAWLTAHGPGPLPDLSDTKRSKLDPWAKDRIETRRGRLAGISSEGELILTRDDVLSSVWKRGSTAAQIAERLSVKLGEEITVDRVRPHLSRLLGAGGIAHEDGLWSKPEAEQ